MVAGEEKEKGGEKTTPVRFGEIGEEKKGGGEGEATVNKIGEIEDNNRRRSKSPKGKGDNCGRKKEVGIGEGVFVGGEEGAIK